MGMCVGSSMATSVEDARLELFAGKRNPMNTSLLLELLFYNILSIQHIRLDAYGVR